MKKLLITVGGTGGHIFPAISVAKNIKNVDILFAGGKLSKNHYFDQNAFPFIDIASAPLSSKNPFTLLRDAGLICYGIWQSRKIIKQFKPDLILGFGSFYTLPMLLAAKWTNTPFILHEANSIPGKVNRLMGPYAKITGVQFPKAAELMKGKTKQIALPLRSGFQKADKEKKKAYAYYGLDPSKMTILIFGGSQGALAINTLIAEGLPALKRDVQFIHLTGKSEVKLDYAKYGLNAVIKSFEDNMALPWQIADLIISRAGANTIAEQMEFEVPGILIPYPYATDQHQEINADFMVEIGGAEKYRQKELTPKKLMEIITKFIDNKALLTEKINNIANYKEKTKTQTLASLVIEIL